MMYKTAKNSTPQQISIKILLLRQETVSCKLFRLMALRHSAFYTPYLLTISAGLLKQQGLDYSYTLATPENTVEDAINDGTVDVSQYPVAASFAGLEKAQSTDLFHIAPINKMDGCFCCA